MAQLATGGRLRSTACTAEVMVIKAPAAPVEVTCGGAPMADAKAPAGDKVALDPGHAGGCAIGKRYVDESGDLELLCVKAGQGGLAANGVALSEKGTKKLPSSD